MTNSLGRPCSVCSHPNIQEIHARVLRGDSIARIAVENRLSQSALYRHARTHLAPELRDALTPAQNLDVSDFLSRQLEIADDLRDTRQRAQRSGAQSTAVRAAAAEPRALEGMLERLGVDSREVVGNLASGEALARSVSAAVKSNPEIASPIVAELRERGENTLAAALESSITPARLLLDQMEAQHDKRN